MQQKTKTRLVAQCCGRKVHMVCRRVPAKEARSTPCQPSAFAGKCRLSFSTPNRAEPGKNRVLEKAHVANKTRYAVAMLPPYNRFPLAAFAPRCLSASATRMAHKENRQQ